MPLQRTQNQKFCSVGHLTIAAELKGDMVYGTINKVIIGTINKVRSYLVFHVLHIYTHTPHTYTRQKQQT